MDLYESVYRNKEHPYYIYTPRWIDTSAGIRALHYLCHSLNNSGHKAFLIISEAKFQKIPRISGFLNTPILTQEIADSHFRAKLTPITVLSETIPGNPFDAPFVVRYLMNYVGALAGPDKFDSSEMIIGFSQNISNEAMKTLERDDIQTLFIPPVDPRDFNFSNAEREDVIAIYAGKYRAFIGVPPKVTNGESIEILRQGAGAQTRAEVIEILKKVKAVVSFENSSILSEAVLSGTPGFFYPNLFLESAIAEQELGWFGLGWGWSEENYTKAKDSVLEGRKRYLEAVAKYIDDLEKFVKKSQAGVIGQTYSKKVLIPEYRYFINRHRLRIAKQVLRTGGLRKLGRLVLDFMGRRLTYRYWVNKNGGNDIEILGF